MDLSVKEIFEISPVIFTSACIVVGLVIGSFLNVVIYRVPLFLDNLYHTECINFLKIEDTNIKFEEPINLIRPRSHCPKCKIKIKWYHNIPVLSYLWLKAKCNSCKNKISIQYPLIEISTACFFTIQGLYFGPSFELFASCILTSALIALSMIDIEHKILPDQITLTILWLGLNINVFQTFTTVEEAILGATLGYTSLWMFASIYEKITGKFAMGHGDFKLLACAGAWLGWQQLLFIVLLSSLVASIIGLTLILVKNNNRNSELPFGPYLSIAIWLSLIWGDDIMIAYYAWINLGW